MAKSCHDIDWIRYIMGVPCERVSSFGSLSHFRRENKPAQAGDAKRCLECPAAPSCPYAAQKLYLGAVERGEGGTWPTDTIVSNAEPDIESVTDALRTGPYGRCVYECDNNVNDNQVVIMEFEGRKTVNFLMVAFSKDVCVRKTRIFGTHGQLECDGEQIVWSDFRTGEQKTLEPVHVVENTTMNGHGYADWFLMNNFVSAVACEDHSRILSGPEETLESHLLVFAAEKARKENRVVETSTYVASANVMSSPN